MPRDDIEALQEEIETLKKGMTDLLLVLGKTQNELEIEKSRRVKYADKPMLYSLKDNGNCRILVKKLLEAKPELEEWVKLNFGEYL